MHSTTAQFSTIVHYGDFKKMFASNKVNA